MLHLCCRFLCNPLKDVDLKKWAAEGLAFLSLDADVKEDLVHDSEALKALFDLAKVIRCLRHFELYGNIRLLNVII